jgi:ATP-dependent Lon protease
VQRENTMTLERNDRVEIPVLALRDVVVYPHMVIPLFVGREKSIKCLEAAMDKDKQIFLVAQKDATVDEPEKDDIYRVGTIATVLQLLKLPDGTVKVLVEGTQRANIEEFVDNEDFFVANAQFIESDSVNEQEQDIFIRSALSQFEGYVKLNKKIPPEVMTSVSGIDEPARLADTMAAHMPLKCLKNKRYLKYQALRSA